MGSAIDLNEITDVTQRQLVPIGTVMMWAKNLVGTPTLPGTWAEMNGQTISDSDSPYDGETLPDIGSCFCVN